MKSLKYILLVLVLTAFISKDQDITYPPVPHQAFNSGELLDYKVYFSFMNVGRARIKLHPNMYRVNGREAYKLNIWGKTYGAVDWVAQVDDNWGGYVDSVSLLPHMSYRYLSEGNYRKKEVTRFDHLSDMIETKVVNNKTGRFKEPEYFKKTTHEVRDMISGYMFLRTLDYSGYSPGDTLAMEAFFEDSFYDFKIVYDGKDQVKTKIGKLNAIRLKPIMPDNKVFDGENAITVWLSDDENKIPLKADADLFIGHAGIEIINFEEVRYPLNFIREKEVKQSLKDKMNETFSESVEE